ncbi:MAG: hypothetical protein ACK4TB_13185 [Gemmobacter sp.]
MDAEHDNTIAALFYAVTPAINFARLVGDLDAALADMPHDRRVLSWDCDDVAIFDIDGARILLGWAERLEGPRPSCLSVAVGPGPDGTLPDRLRTRRAAVAALIVERIGQRLPAADVVWHSAPGVMTADRLDEATDILLDSIATGRPTADWLPEAEARAGAEVDALPHVPDLADDGALRVADAQVADDRAGVRRAQHGCGASRGTRNRAQTAAQGPAALDRLMARMERELVATQMPTTAERNATAAAVAAILRGPKTPAAPPAPRRGDKARSRARAAAAAAATVANDVPDIPRTASAELLRIRAALYPPAEPPARPTASMPIRIAVGATGATLVIVAAPVGAALLTYNALRGADLALTARAVALTGAALGFLEMPGFRALLGLA